MAPKTRISGRRMVIPSSVLQTPTRPRFFAGQLLTADDLRLEQEYLDRKRHLQNLATLGPGVVTGLAVSVESDDAGVRVGAGYAVDAWGREIIVPEDMCLPWPTTDGRPPRRWGVVIEYAERDTDPVPTTDGKVATTVSEGSTITVITEPPAGDDGRVVLRPFGPRTARTTRKRG